MKKFKIHKLRFSLFLILVFISIAVPTYFFLMKHHPAIKIPTETMNNQNKETQEQNIDDNIIPESDTHSQDFVISQPIHSYIEGSNASAQGKIYYSGPSTQKMIALTFDDGPDRYFTGKILDILKQYNVKATFFEIGKNAKAYPSVIKRIDKEGHAIGNHTYDHANLNHLSSEQIASEITKTDNILDSIIGHHNNILRPPYGINSSETIKTVSGMGYKVIDWSVDTRDWAGTPPSKIMNYVLDETRPGAIILHHCSSSRANGLDNTLNALPHEILMLKSKGYQFVTVPQLLGT